METRILTLFDDEDFFPKEEPKKKVPVKKVPEIQENVAETAPETVPEAIEPADQSQEIAIAFNGEVIASEDKNTEENTLPDEAREEPVVQAEEGAGPDVAADNETVKLADEELSRQILSELIQTDYTALIHKDYPFDIQSAQVVKKDKEIRVDVPEVSGNSGIPAEEETIEEPEEEVFEDIVPLPEWNLDKKYYTIGEVAQLFSVNTSHIRFWTTEFRLKPRTTRKGDRLYSPKDIAQLRLIHHLVKEKKHTIKGAREKLKAGKDSVATKLDLKDSLVSLKEMLVNIKEQL
jgi:DNA-binding transcriptional MerR regulator